MYAWPILLAWMHIGSNCHKPLEYCCPEVIVIARFKGWTVDVRGNRHVSFITLVTDRWRFHTLIEKQFSGAAHNPNTRSISQPVKTFIPMVNPPTVYATPSLYEPM